MDLCVHNSVMLVGSEYKNKILAIEYLTNYLSCSGEHWWNTQEIRLENIGDDLCNADQG